MRVSHEQNLILPHVALDDLPAVYDALAEAGLATANAGLDHRHHRLPGPRLLRAGQCPLDPDRAAHLASASPTSTGSSEIGELKIKISGCINACGHHHVGHIGILGVEKKGEEFYQITLGGSGDETRRDRRDHRPRLLQRRGRRRRRDAGRDLSRACAQSPDETFLDAYRRLGQAPFKEALYGAA